MSITLATNFREIPSTKRKYRRYQNEKRIEREKGMKRIQTPRIITTKWDPEIANKKTHKIGRSRSREDKYGCWNYNETDCKYEDNVNAEIRARKPEKFTSLKPKELRADGWTDFGDLYWAAEETARAIQAIEGIVRSHRIHAEPSGDDSGEYIFIANELNEDEDVCWV
jgi:hypothetical protein